MNTIITSKEEILKHSRELLQKKGWNAINIRALATACHVSVGSIYNYFPSKAELVSETIASVWLEIFHQPDEAFQTIEACVRWMFERMRYAQTAYPGFFTLHAFSFAKPEKSEGKKRMEETWTHMEASLCAILHSDPNIRPDAFNARLSEKQFAHVLFSLMMSAWLRHDFDPDVVLEIVRRTVY